jgi:hypothetical protein
MLYNSMQYPRRLHLTFISSFSLPTLRNILKVMNNKYGFLNSQLKVTINLNMQGILGSAVKLETRWTFHLLNMCLTVLNFNQHIEICLSRLHLYLQF